MPTKIRLLLAVPLILLGCSSQPTIAGVYSCNLNFKLSDRSTPISRLIGYGSQIEMRLGEDKSYAMSIEGSPALLGTYEVDAEEIHFQTASDRTDSLAITKQRETSLVLGDNKIICVPKDAEGGE